MTAPTTPTYSSVIQRLNELYLAAKIVPTNFAAGDDVFFSQFECGGLGLTKYSRGRVMWQIVYTQPMDENGDEIEGDFIVDVFGDRTELDHCLTKIYLTDFEQDRWVQPRVCCHDFEKNGFWVPAHYLTYRGWMNGRESFRNRIWSHNLFGNTREKLSGLSLLGNWALGQYDETVGLRDYGVLDLDHGSDQADVESEAESAYTKGMFYEAKIFDLEIASDASRLQAQKAAPLSLRRLCFLSELNLKTVVQQFGPTGLFLRERVLTQITDECHDKVDEELLSAFPV